MEASRPRVAPANADPEPAMLTSSDAEVPARMSPEPATLSDTGPSVLATFQLPQPALPSSTEAAPRPTEPNTAPDAETST